MAAPNGTPIFTRKGNIGSALFNSGVGSNTNMVGSGSYQTLFTADSAVGSYLDYVLCTPTGSNSASALTLLLFDSGGTYKATIGDVALPATTTSNSAPMPQVPVPINLVLPPGWTLRGAVRTTVVGLSVTAFGGDF